MVKDYLTQFALPFVIGSPTFPVMPKEKPDSFSVRAIRERLNLTRNQLAEVAGVSRRTVEGWEVGRPVPKPTQKLLEALGSKIIRPPSA